MLHKFMTAMEARDEAALLQLFAPDATWTADGGGKAGAGLHPIVGADRMARLAVGLRETVLGAQSDDADRHGERRNGAVSS